MSGCFPPGNDGDILIQEISDFCIHKIPIKNGCYLCKFEKFGEEIKILHAHIDKLHDMINMEDRITASDVLNRLTLLEDEIKFNMSPEVKKLLDSMDSKIIELEKTVTQLVDKIAEIANFYYKEKKTPFKCPVCEGCGNSKGQIEPNPNFEFSMKYASCHACEGKGVVWG